MTKVWVPVDLPDDCEIEHVLVKGRHQTFTVLPCGASVADVGKAIWRSEFDREQQLLYGAWSRAEIGPVTGCRDRWEHEVVEFTTPESLRRYMTQCIDEKGWEGYAVIPGVAFFRRRVA